MSELYGPRLGPNLSLECVWTISRMWMFLIRTLKTLFVPCHEYLDIIWTLSGHSPDCLDPVQTLIWTCSNLYMDPDRTVIWPSRYCLNPSGPCLVCPDHVWPLCDFCNLVSPCLNSGLSGPCQGLQHSLWTVSVTSSGCKTICTLSGLGWAWIEKSLFYYSVILSILVTSKQLSWMQNEVQGPIELTISS